MEYKLSDIINQCNKDDFLRHCMIVVNNDDEDVQGNKIKTISIRKHSHPSYGYADPEVEDTPEWFDSWWTADITFNIDTGEILYEGWPSCSGAKEGDIVIIDCNYDDYIVVDCD